MHSSANLDVAANRVLFGKFTNNGQTCIAPDYVLVDAQVQTALVDLMRTKLQQWFGADASKSADYSRIVNTRHARRIASYIDECRDHVIFGGQYNVDERFIGPTLLLNPPATARVLTDEIFGPVLPIIVVNGPQDAINYIRARCGAGPGSNVDSFGGRHLLTVRAPTARADGKGDAASVRVAALRPIPPRRRQGQAIGHVRLLQ